MFELVSDYKPSGDQPKAIEKLVHSGTRLVVLSHISEHSNTTNLAVNTIANYLESKNIIPNVNATDKYPIPIGTPAFSPLIKCLFFIMYSK